jgi:NAD-dependent DNA ligase
LTGMFESGSRANVAALIEAFGGSVAADVRATTDYLLIGSVASASWAHSSYGRKIECAVEMRTKGHPVAIICETHWLKCFPKIADLLSARGAVVGA